MGFEFEYIYKGSEDFPVGIFGQSAYISQMHHHQEYELFYLESGTATIILNNKKTEIKPDDVFYITPGVDHCVLNQSKDFYYYAIIFDSSVFGSTKESTRKIFDQVIVNEKISLTKPLLNKIIKTTKLLNANIFGKELALKNLVYEIFLHVVETKQYAPLPSIKNYTTEKRCINNGLLYIKNHYKENITLEDLLNSTNYSKSHFIRLFKDNTGMNYTDYLNRYRIEQACHDLIYTSKNISQVACENGFNNLQYFSRTFKRYMECTPKQYQKKWKLH